MLFFYFQKYPISIVCPKVTSHFPPTLFHVINNFKYIENWYKKQKINEFSTFFLYKKNNFNFFKNFPIFFSFFKNQVKENKFLFSFIRVQRRYNKRRYSKIRTFSRSPFFAGCCFSTIFVSGFWNGTHKTMDWLTAWPTIIDMQSLLIIICFYYSFKFIKSYTTYFFLYQKKKKIKTFNFF